METDRQLLALDYIAAMTYQTRLNVDALERKCVQLPNSSLRDVAIIFVANQKSWVAKLLRGMRAIGIKENMENDLTSEGLAYYSIICEYARKTNDMHAATNIMEVVSEAEDIPEDVQMKIIELLKPLKKIA